MADPRYHKASHAVFNLKYHFVCCPKYRRKVFIGNIAKRLEELLYEKAKELELGIESIEIMPDHIHLFFSADTTDSPHRIANQFKGYTSRILRKEFPELLKMPSLWTRAYYISSIGHISEAIIKKYIEQQRKK
jgi:putative transposase